ncbi:hypothetical protein O6H91_14G034900 [Diphasiastrum complanatum]|nr:hypothetical protein O6H91_14G034900 [Diphasiastrum complanatum]
MYMDCGSLEDAQKSFDSLVQRDVASWTTLIGGYAKHSNGEISMQLFRKMQWEGFEPNKITLLSLLNVYANPAYLEEGKLLHNNIRDKGFNLDIFLGTALIKMYSKCGSLDDAISLFHKIPNRDLVVWNTMIAAFASYAYDEMAVQLFEDMKHSGIKPDKITFVSLLDSCATTEALTHGQLVHGFIDDSEYKHDVAVRNALIKMYSKCGSLLKAQQSFDEMLERNVISWTTIIRANAQHGLGLKSLLLFDMMQRQGVKPDKVAFVTIIDVCAQLKALEEGKRIHAQLAHYNLELDVVLGTALLNMYGKCGCLEESQKLFDKIPDHNVLCWTVMISIYASHSQGKKALQLFRQMQSKGVKADKITFVSCLEACANVTYLAEAKGIHSCIIHSGLETDILVGNALLTMYGKCGCLEDALGVFNKLPERDVISYNAIITAFAQHGHGKAAFQFFAQMQHESLKPGDITFSSMLSACSHAGLLEEGCHYFASVNVNRDILVKLEHYGCMIDIFGRTGQLSQAEDLIRSMFPQPNEVVWMSLLNACRIHEDIERAQRAADHLLELDPDNSVPYLVLVSMFTRAGRWEDASKLKRLLMDKHENTKILGITIQEQGQCCC